MNFCEYEFSAPTLSATADKRATYLSSMQWGLGWPPENMPQGPSTMCYHAEFCHSTSKGVDMSREPQKLDSIKANTLRWGRADPHNTLLHVLPRHILSFYANGYGHK